MAELKRLRQQLEGDFAKQLDELQQQLQAATDASTAGLSTLLRRCLWWGLLQQGTRV